VFVSARTGAGLDTLRAALLARLEARIVQLELTVHGDAGRILSYCYREGRVEQQDQDDAGHPRLVVRFSDAASQRLQQLHGDDIEVRTLRGGNGARPAAALWAAR
jgi:50S ribosomal subunit-associated GTPase HflX